MKIQIFRLVFILLLGIITIPICDCTKKEEFNNSDIAIVDIKQESTWDYWVVCKDGDYFFLQETNSKPSNVLMHTGKTNTDIPIFFNQEGLPEKVIIGDYIFVLKNHSGTYVDLAVILPNGEIEVAKNIKSDMDWDQFKTKNSNTTGAVSDVIRWTSLAVGAIPCVLSLASTLVPVIAIPLIAWSCGSYLLNYFINNKGDELGITFGLTDFAHDWKYINMVSKCTTPDYVACSSSVVSTSLSILADYVETLEQNSDKISEVTTILNNGLIIFNPDLTYGTLSDVDGNIYKTIQIGTQTWMAQNLRTTKYNDNINIPEVKEYYAWQALSTPGYCWYVSSSVARSTYGALYNWYTVDAVSNGGKNVCPTGWHVPSDGDWTTLTTYLGGENIANNKLKEIGVTHWLSAYLLTDKVNNESGFTALPGGYRNSIGFCNDLSFNGYWWSTSESNQTGAWSRLMGWSGFSVSRMSEIKKSGFSVRCLRDN